MIYSLGGFSKIPFGDSVVFALIAEIGLYEKTATPHSHYLYSNCVLLLREIFGFDGILASRVLIFFSAAATVSAVFYVAMLLTRKTWASIVGSIVSGFSFTFWKNAEIIEAYTFNTLLLSIFSYYIFCVF